ncbi:hypothetical protein BD769DRAFT_1677791 [Suillus cothurnatus]|nr:hypothetical protein BD769DRAFT_1677791 [Suillus cothurnatus]
MDNSKVMQTAIKEINTQQCVYQTEHQLKEYDLAIKLRDEAATTTSASQAQIKEHEQVLCRIDSKQVIL